MEKKLILAILPGVQSMFIEYAKCVLLDIWIKYCTFKTRYLSIRLTSGRLERYIQRVILKVTVGNTTVFSSLHPQIICQLTVYRVGGGQSKEFKWVQITCSIVYKLPIVLLSYGKFWIYTRPVLWNFTWHSYQVSYLRFLKIKIL